MSHEQDGLEARVPGGKNCLHHDSNHDPDHRSCDDPDECVGDNGSENKTQTARQIQRYLACLAGTAK